MALASVRSDRGPSETPASSRRARLVSPSARALFSILHESANHALHARRTTSGVFRDPVPSGAGLSARRRIRHVGSGLGEGGPTCFSRKPGKQNLAIFAGCRIKMGG